MAGLLSKGITLAYKNEGMAYKHTFVRNNFDGAVTPYKFSVLSDSPFPIGGNVWTNRGKFIGLTLVSKEEMDDGNIEEINEVIKEVWDDGSEVYFGVPDMEEEAQRRDLIFIMDYESAFYTETITPVASSTPTAFNALTNLQEIPELGNNAPEKIDVTVLSDGAKKSINGLSDTAQDLAFKFLYDEEQFNVLAKLTGSYLWRVTLPDGTRAEFTATPSVKLAGVGVSAALSYTLTLSVESEIVFA